MPNYIVFNTVNFDGIGDFIHFKDIMLALLANPVFKEVVFTAIVAVDSRCTAAHYQRIREELESLGVPFHYGNIREHRDTLSKDIDLQKKLQTADQAIIISFDGIFRFYKSYFKTNTPIKLIGEHECNLAGPEVTHFPLCKEHSLGLGEKRIGLKVKNHARLAPSEAWRVIEATDPHVSSALLKHANEDGFEAFFEHNVLVPAYFNNPNDFFMFVSVFKKNESLSGEKNIIFVQSGFKYENMTSEEQQRYNALYLSLYGSNIAQVDIVTPDSDPMIIAKNSKGSKTIRICSGFYLSHLSYDALYQLAQVAGVSGDNSLEHAVSMDVLPFYHSTNQVSKRATIYGLREITQLVDIPLSAKKSFQVFFTDAFLGDVWDVDFPEMIKAWPLVTAYLRRYHNAYDNLQGIVLENVPPPLTNTKQRLSELKNDDSPSGSISCNIS